MSFAKVRTAILLGVGIFLVVWNAILGDQNTPTFVVGLMFCGFPVVLNVDQAIRAQSLLRRPVPPASPDPDPVRETAP